MSGSSFTFAAGRRAKWVVFAIWFVAIFIAAGPANLPGKFEDAESNEATSYLPGSAESTKALDATESLQKGEIAPAVIIYRRESGLTAGRPPDDRRRRRDDDREALPGSDRRRRHRGRRRQEADRDRERRREGRPEAAASGLRRADDHRARAARRLRPFRRPDLLAGRQGRDRHLLHQRQRRGRTDPRPGQVLARKDLRPGRWPPGQDHRRRRLLGRRDRSLRRDQRHPAARRGQPRDLPADRDLPLADVLLHPAGRGDLRRDSSRARSATASPSSGSRSTASRARSCRCSCSGRGPTTPCCSSPAIARSSTTPPTSTRRCATALASAGPAIFASAATVIAALLCLMIAKVNGTSGLGPIAAIGIACAALSRLTLLPALLTIFGRRAFWPFVPHTAERAPSADAGLRPRAPAHRRRLRRRRPRPRLPRLPGGAGPAAAGAAQLAPADAQRPADPVADRRPARPRGLHPLRDPPPPREHTSDATHGFWSAGRRAGRRVSPAGSWPARSSCC